MSEQSISDIESTIAAKLAAIQENGVTSNAVTYLDTSAAYQDSFWLSVIILIFGLVIALVMAYLVKNNNEPESLLRSFGTVIIIIAAVFLIVAGYSEKQIAPVIGLLGTIAGYLLGKSTPKKLYKNSIT
jgi:uncharacterized protein YacL